MVFNSCLVLSFSKMSIRRAPPPSAAQERRAPADVGALTRSFADVLRAGTMAPLRSPAVLLRAAPAAPAVEAYPPRQRPNVQGASSNTWETMRDYVMRCVLSLQNSGVPGAWPYQTKEEVWVTPDAGYSTALHDMSLAPYAALMVLRSSDSNTQYGAPHRFVMRPSDHQARGRFILCEDLAPGTPSGQEKTMWYFEITSLTIDGQFVEYPAGGKFISFNMTLRPANEDWDTYKLSTPAHEAYAKGYTDDHDYSKYETGYEKKHPDAHKPRLTRLEINHATGEGVKPETLGTSPVYVEAGLEWAEMLERRMTPNSASGLALLKGTPDDPVTRLPLIPTQKLQDFWLSSMARRPAPGKLALSTVLVHAISDAIMQAITQKVSSTWPHSVAEWAADKETARQTALARAAAMAALPRPPPRPRRRYHDDAMHDAFVAGGEDEAEPYVGDQNWLPPGRRRR